MHFLSVLFIIAFTSLSFAKSTRPQYICETVTQKGNRLQTSFATKSGSELVEQEFLNPVSGMKEKAILSVPQPFEGDGLRLELQIQVKSRWQTLARVLVGGDARSALLQDADRNYVSCIRR